VNKKRMLLSVCAVGIAGLLGVTGGLAVAATSTARSPKASYWEQTHSNINMSVTGGTLATIETLALPAGNWVLHADQSLVNFGPSDYAGCQIGDSATPDLNAHRTMVGNPNASASLGPSSFVTELSETAAVSLLSPDTITVTCEHDDTNGSTPYIDSNADLSANKTSALSIIQLP
jgi:hypothetical protein